MDSYPALERRVKDLEDEMAAQKLEDAELKGKRSVTRWIVDSVILLACAAVGTIAWFN